MTSSRMEMSVVVTNRVIRLIGVGAIAIGLVLLAGVVLMLYIANGGM
jgi:hypothetical protein